jgi:lysophospholipase L1-like esterase
MRTAAILALLLTAALPAPAAERCTAPPELTAAADTFPQTARAAAEKGHLVVLVVGSASTTGSGTSTPDSVYPARVEAALRTLLPGVAVEVTARGGRGLTAPDLLKLLEQALPEVKPDLVIWQTGTVDAVRGLDPDVFAATLVAGFVKVSEAKADLVLMDMQFSRFGRAVMNYGPYREAMQAVAVAAPNGMLFRRYDLMRHWAETGQVDVERAPRAAWPRETDRLHACLGLALAKTIAEGMRLSR